MGKISPVSAKYIVHATIEIDGVVDRPDVIGAIFGQTEGLLGSDLELRELQRSGRIGRIEVNLDTRSGKSSGKITIPSSLDKAETSIIAAALEIIQRIGPCNAKVRVEDIEDVRVSKRSFVIERAKELLKQIMDKVMPDSQELADEVAYSVRVMEITEYGKERLPAGPSIDESDEVIVVEGRADVLNLLKHGFKNVIALNGTSVPETIIDLAKKKVVTAFVDGDRGGDLIIKELLVATELDYVTKAPDGKEVEEITKKEIHKCLRSRITAEQARLEFGKDLESTKQPYPNQQYQQPQGQVKMAQQPIVRQSTNYSAQQSQNLAGKPIQQPVQQTTQAVQKVTLTAEERQKFSDMIDDLIGTRGAYVLDQKLTILGKVPTSELATTIKSLQSGMYAIVMDGVVDKNLFQIAEKANIRFMVAMDAKFRQQGSRLNVITVNEL